MKTWSKIFLITMIVGGVVACQSPSKKQMEFRKTMDKVIEVHDSLMKKMGTLSNLIEKVKSNKNIPIDKREDLLDALQNSYDEMMEWMQDFGEKFPNPLEKKKLSPQELKKKLPILREQKEDVIELKHEMIKSIKMAQKYIKSS